MADYKKKKIKKSLFHKKKHFKNDAKDSNLDKNLFKFEDGNDKDDDIKVIKGSKFKRIRRYKIFISIFAFITLTCLVLSAVLPGGLYENTLNYFATIGSGAYPTSISGGTIKDVVSNGYYYYVLTDTNITVYSSGGKIVLNEFHGFSNPIISTSATRALLYDQGGNAVNIYNLTGKLHTINTKGEIITASISDDGDFVVATHSKSYTSTATVYDDDFNEIYTWNSAKEFINNVLVDTDGDKLAISTFDVVSGQYKSKLQIFNFDSASPIHTLDFGNSLVLKIGNTGDGISIITDDKYNFLDWSDFNLKSISFSGEINSFKNADDGVLLTVNRPNDRSDNNVILVSDEGEEISEIKISDVITDIHYDGGRVYSLCDTSIFIYNEDGKVLRKGNCNYGTRKIVVVSSDSVACLNDTEIIQIEIEESEK